jgi:uncharacterized protein YabE (DUF348 family)
VQPPAAVPGRSEVWSIVLEFLTGRAGRVAGSAAVLAAVVGGTLVYTHSDPHVTLLIDGASRQVSAGAGTVRGVLADQSIATTGRDLVAPALDSAVHDGETVVVRLARPLTVTVDGQAQTYWTTALTVQDALAAIGLRSQGALLSASRSQPLGRQGLALQVTTPKTVSVAADGRTRSVTTTSATVGALMTELGLTLRPLDRLSVAAQTPVRQGLSIALTRIDRKRITATETVSFGTTRRNDGSLYRGSTKVLSPGRAGSRQAVYDLVLTDGKVTARTLVAARVTLAPVSTVLAVGTKARPVVSSGGGSSGGGGSVAGADGLNWAALARCESGGNPRAVNPAGYYGLYQFSLSTWRSVGGSGNPIDASPSEQLYRAKVLYKKAGAGQWGCGHWLFT